MSSWSKCEPVTPNPEREQSIPKDLIEAGKTQKASLAAGLNAAIGQVDAQRVRAGERALDAASQLRNQASDIPGGEMTDDLAYTAAEQMERIGGYLQEREVASMRRDVIDVLRSRPAIFLLASGAVALFLYWVLRD